MKAVLIRHTAVLAQPGICYGRRDVPMAKTFLADASDVARRLPWPPEKVWSSPAVRCLKLAEFLARGREVFVDERLWEVRFGTWEGLPWPEPDDDAARRWYAQPWSERPPGGESAEDLLRRVSEFREEFLRGGNDRAVIVTHAGVIRAWRSLATGKALAETFSEPIAYGEIVSAD